MNSGQPGFWDGLVIFVAMSWIGPAYTLVWYRLRIKVIDIVAGERARLDYECAVIDVMGLAEVRYGLGYLQWYIKRPADYLSYTCLSKYISYTGWTTSRTKPLRHNPYFKSVGAV